MINICERYLKSYETRSNITVISEVLSALIVDKYILKNDIINVGDSQQGKLPDIHTQDKICGFEVTRCESEKDFYHDDVQKFLESNNYDYKVFEKIDNVNSYNEVSNLIDKELFKRLKKYKIEVTVDNNKIISSTHGFDFHDIFWLEKVYSNAITTKLRKLNKGNYSACSNVSLVLIMIKRMGGIEQANIIKDIYSSIYDNYQEKFKNIYLFTIDDIFEITNKQVKLIYHYQKEEFGLLVSEMKRILKIHEYKN